VAGVDCPRLTATVGVLPIVINLKILSTQW
jgi:hypothetical protein